MSEDLRVAVVNLHRQGLTNYQVVQYLQQQGYSPDDITFALEAAQQGKGAQQPAPQEGVSVMQEPQNPMKFKPNSAVAQQNQQQEQQSYGQQINNSSPGFSQQDSQQPPFPPPGGPSSQNSQPPQGMPQFPPPSSNSSEQDLSADDVEELIEAIIEEKWNELKKNVEKLISWKDQMDDRINKVKQKQEDLEAQFDKVHNAVLGKVGEYDKNIKEVGGQLQAMEKLFSDVLPKFTENVNTLNRVTERMAGSGHNRQQ